jgi:hypothetical protein
MWPWFEMAWEKILEEKNEQLKEQGRKQISRYHASDCSNLLGEFKGWTPDEQIEFSLKLFKVFRDHPVHIHSFDLPLQMMVEEFPETKPNSKGFAYVILLTMLIHQIGEGTLSLYPNEAISLHHDHCDYDGALADTFGRMINESAFKYPNRFTSLTSEYWQHCLLLQPADMIAYENFKEGIRQHYPEGRNRRKSLKAILDLDAISGRASGLDRDGIRDMKTIIDGLDEKTRNILFHTARIKK